VDARLFANFHHVGLEHMFVSLVDFVAGAQRIYARRKKSSSLQVSVDKIHPKIQLTCLRLLRCILYLKLFLLGGFTWIFEVLSYTFNNHAPSAWVWMIVDSLNCLHGVLIFFVLIIWRQRIRKELAGKRILWIYMPTKWADVEDDEQICLANEGNNA
jgi:hypothetical protein